MLRFSQLSNLKLTITMPKCCKNELLKGKSVPDLCFYPLKQVKKRIMFNNIYQRFRFVLWFFKRGPKR